jgi:predicted Zn-dependent protease
MKISLVVALAVCAVLSGCSQHQSLSPEQQTATVLYRPADSETLLSCLDTEYRLTRNQLKAATQKAKEQYKQNPGKSATLRMICLSLHPQAGYRQFKSGITLLDGYIKQSSEAGSGLQGLRHLLQRLNQERVARWQQSVKTSDTTEALDIENRELLERNSRLEQTVEQEQARSEELRRQIDQLKNIETILKNREQ